MEVTNAGTRVVPFLDLSPMNAPLRESLLSSIAQLIDGGAFTNGPSVAEFEEAFAKYCEATHCVGVSNGLDALRLALIALGVTPGDEVVVPANTFVATVEAVVQAGGRPVLVDASVEDYNIDVSQVAAAVGPRTRAVIPVHLYGQLTDMRHLLEITQRLEIPTLEDAAQAHGATRDGLRAGTIGEASAFSFYPGKNLGAFGDAGAVVTNSTSVARAIRALREHGQLKKYVHELVGWTARLDTLQAAVLVQKLPLLDDWNEQRRAIAAHYFQSLSGVGDLVLPPVPSGSQPVWHLFVIRTADPAALANALSTRGISTGRHYPEPVHLAEAYRPLGYPRGSFPVSEQLARECLSLPMFPGMTDEQMALVVSAIETYFRTGH